MEILEQIRSKEKAFNVIESCETIPQCESAENYVTLYLDKFEDMIGFEDLKRFLKQHKVELVRTNKK